MCGINGFNFRNEELIKKMMRVTHSRGPDNQGFYSSEIYTVGHNRLSIIDPEAGSSIIPCVLVILNGCPVELLSNT